MSDENGLVYMRARYYSYATYMIYSGADLETVRALLGRVDIATTQRYLDSGMRQMRNATDNLSFSCSA